MSSYQMGDSPTVSVVIVTLNRADAIGLLLQELASQDFENFEIIVVVGPCEDHTHEVLQPFSKLIKIVTCEDSNISKSRNIGIQHAAGDFVIFIDDDAYPEKSSWISDYVEFFRKSENPDRLGIVGGPVLVKNGGYYEFKAGSFDREGFQVFQKEDSTSDSEPDRWMTRIAGGNNVARRELLLKMGGYDENIEYYLDETDLCIRLIDEGYCIQQSEIGIRHYRLPNRTRKSAVQVNRFVVAKSDFYFTIKHSGFSTWLRPFRPWFLLARKHYCKEIFFQGYSNRLNSAQKIVSFLSILGGGFAGTWAGLFRKPTLRNLDSGKSFLKIQKKALKSTALEHVAFINDEMGEGSNFFQRESEANHQLQVYWSNDGSFTEKKVETIEYPDKRWCKLSFSFKHQEPFKFIRFDPMRKPGFCTVKSIKFYDGDGNVVLDCNEELVTQHSGMQLMQSGSPLFDIVSESEDPWMVLHSEKDFREIKSCCVILKSLAVSHS